jgi:hypothetical protein
VAATRVSPTIGSLGMPISMGLPLIHYWLKEKIYQCDRCFLPTVYLKSNANAQSGSKILKNIL